MGDLWKYKAIAEIKARQEEESKIQYKDGVKGEGDKKVIWNGVQVTFIEVAEIVQALCENEDRIYPPPKYRGGQMLLDFLNEVYKNKGVDDKILQRYRLGKYKPWNQLISAHSFCYFSYQSQGITHGIG